MPLSNVTCVLRRHFKEELDVLFTCTYSIIKGNDEITIRISVGMNDVDLCSILEQRYSFTFQSR